MVPDIGVVNVPVVGDGLIGGGGGGLVLLIGGSTKGAGAGVVTGTGAVYEFEVYEVEVKAAGSSPGYKITSSVFRSFKGTYTGLFGGGGGGGLFGVADTGELAVPELVGVRTGGGGGGFLGADIV